MGRRAAAVYALLLAAAAATTASASDLSDSFTNAKSLTDLGLDGPALDLPGPSSTFYAIAAPTNLVAWSFPTPTPLENGVYAVERGSYQGKLSNMAASGAGLTSLDLMLSSVSPDKRKRGLHLHAFGPTPPPRAMRRRGSKDDDDDDDKVQTVHWRCSWDKPIPAPVDHNAEVTAHCDFQETAGFRIYADIKDKDGNLNYYTDGSAQDAGPFKLHAATVLDAKAVASGLQDDSSNINTDAYISSLESQGITLDPNQLSSLSAAVGNKKDWNLRKPASCDGLFNSWDPHNPCLIGGIVVMVAAIGGGALALWMIFKKRY